MRTGGGPFSCGECGERDKNERNCSNFKGLSERALAIERYDEPVRLELLSKSCRKVMSLGELRLYECPLSYISGDTLDVMRVVFMMDEGALFFEGGLADQPCWAIEAREIYQSEKARTAGEKNGSKV